MEQCDRKALTRMLTELMSAQDDVTHYNENGLMGSVRAAQNKRDRIKRRILDYVEGITTPVERAEILSRQAQEG